MIQQFFRANRLFFESESAIHFQKTSKSLTSLFVKERPYLNRSRCSFLKSEKQKSEFPTLKNINTYPVKSAGPLAVKRGTTTPHWFTSWSPRGAALLQELAAILKGGGGGQVAPPVATISIRFEHGYWKYTIWDIGRLTLFYVLYYYIGAHFINVLYTVYNVCTLP